MTGQPHVVELARVKISPEGVLLRGDEVMDESFARPENFRRWKRKRRNKRFREIFQHREVREIESAVWVTDDWSKGYFHWLADVLPKLVIAADHLKNSTVLLPARYRGSDLVKDSFKVFGVGRFEFVGDNETVLAQRLYMPYHTAESGTFDSEVMKKVRRSATSGLPPGAAPHKRIYISRSLAKRRKIVNDAEVSGVLAEFGFETVLAEKLSFLDQVRLFSSASHLVSIHGAGLANMLFMPNGGRIMEFRKNDPRSADHFLNMAAALGHEYLRQSCPAKDEAQAPYSADLTVDLHLLDDNLRQFLR